MYHSKVTNLLSWLRYCEIKVLYYLVRVGHNRIFCIVTHYGLDSLGIEFRWGRDFLHPSRLVLGPTQLCIQWVLGLPRRKVVRTCH
jgi:hypothetical protein